jgi:hypothetical protein
MEIILILLIFVYFIPSMAAKSRRHRNYSAIAILNLFLGWTLIGWILSLVWAYTDNVEPKLKRST